MVGIGGLVVAVLLWRLALTLVPDTNGVAVSTLSRGRRLAAMLVTVLGGAVGAVLVATALPHQPDVLAFGLFAAVSPGLAVVDWVTHRLPFVTSAAVLVVAVAGFSAQAVNMGDAGRLGRAAWALAIVGTLALVWWRAFDGQVGLGDVVLLAVIGGFAGWGSWIAVWAAIAAGFALAAVAAGVARWRIATAGAYLPLGPFLLAGWWGMFALCMAGCVA